MKYLQRIDDYLNFEVELLFTQILQEGLFFANDDKGVKFKDSYIIIGESKVNQLSRNLHE